MCSLVDAEKNNSRFGLYIASSLVIILLLTLTLPMVFSANKETTYSAYVTSDSAEDENNRLAQVNLMRDSLGETGEDYSIANTMSTPMLVNDWQNPHRTMLAIIAPEKPIDETEARKIYDFVTENGGKVIIAADNTNANRVASMFGVTYFDDPMYDVDHGWYDFDEEGNPICIPDPVTNECPPNGKNVWSLASITESLADPDGDGEGVMDESGQRQGCEASDLTQHLYTGCRMPVMFRAPTGMKVEDNCANSEQDCEIKVLAQASVSACIDVSGQLTPETEDDGDCGNDKNPAPGDLAMMVRIDFPGIKAMDYKKDSSGTLSEIDVTGSILFVSDEEAFSNRLWDFEEAKDTGMRNECDVAKSSCWQSRLTGNSLWNGNEHFFKAVIYSMMEFDNQELSNTVKLSHSNFDIVFDESRHVTGIMSAPFTDAMATIVLLTSDGFLKWLIILNIMLLLLVAMMVVPEKSNWRHVFDLTRFRERPEKLDSSSYRQRVRESLMTKVRIFNDLTRDEMALKPPAEVQTLIGNPRLVELAYSQNRTYSPEELRELLQTIRRWGKEN